MSSSKWMSIKDISQAYDIPERTLQDWCKQGIVPAEKRGKNNSWYINIGYLKEKFEILVSFEEDTRPSTNTAESLRYYEASRKSRNV